MKDFERESWIKEEYVMICCYMCPWMIRDNFGMTYCEINRYEKCCNESDSDDEEE